MPCCQDNLDSWDEGPEDDSRDEDPSDDDLRRLDHETAFCPAPGCGAEVWDSAEVCPKCHAYIGGNTLSRPPVDHWLRVRPRGWFAIVAIILLLAMLWWAL
jgi:hypothetical protein